MHAASFIVREDEYMEMEEGISHWLYCRGFFLLFPALASSSPDDLTEAVVSFGEDLFRRDVEDNRRMGEFGADDILRRSGELFFRFESADAERTW